MPSIKDSSTATLADHSISMEVNQSNFKTLQPDEAFAHLSMLAKMLTLSYQLVSKRLPKDGGTNPDLLNYLKKLQDTLEATVMKHHLDADKPNSDIRLSCTIDPSDSGFPVVVRDFKFLNSDKEQAEDKLQALPDDAKLVDDALYLLFRGHLPRDVILQKLTRNYYEMLQRLSMPQTLGIYPLTYLQEEENFHYCTQSFERLDDHSNIPRFYTLYLRIPSKSYNKPEWREELKQAITNGLSTVTDLELRYLAEKVEAIVGVQLEYLERFDVGPFYSLFTDNGKAVGALIDSEEDYIMMYSKSSVIRTGQAEREKLRERFVGWISGDEHAGQFSPVINSPQYILMPHRLIQKVHNLNISLKEHTKMYGVTSEGEMYE
ncbi:MAG: hypothetical protein GY801_08170 [bacterium]|nr:hypothetical protein [bacterium]